MQNALMWEDTGGRIWSVLKPNRQLILIHSHDANLHALVDDFVFRCNSLPLEAMLAKCAPPPPTMGCSLELKQQGTPPFYSHRSASRLRKYLGRQSPRTSFIRKYCEVLSAPLTAASSTSARSPWVLAKDNDAVRARLLRLAHHDADRRAEVGARHIRELRAKESTTEQQLCDAAIAAAQDEANAADARVQQLVHTARAEPHSAIESNSQPFV